MEKKKILTTIEEVKAISDPFKYRILTSFYKLKAPSTVKQVADFMNEVPAKVHYHVKKMEQAGILKLVYTKEINGIIAKYYEVTAETFDIKCTAQSTEPHKKLMLAEGQRMVSDFYDISKNTFLDELTYHSEIDGKTTCSILMENLYLTDEQFNEFSSLISNFIEKYSPEDSRLPESKEYHFFTTLFKIKNSKKK